MGKFFLGKIGSVIFGVGKLVRKIGLLWSSSLLKSHRQKFEGLEGSCKKISADEKCGVEKLVGKYLLLEKFKSENWYQKLLSRKIGICEKSIQNWKTSIKHFKLKNYCKKFQRWVGRILSDISYSENWFWKINVCVKHFEYENQC